MPSGGLSRWFNEKWVDISRPKEGGGYEPCGRPDASEGKYPKCVPEARAEKMTPEEIKSAIQRKRRAESTTAREDKKPIMVPTIKKASVPADMDLYNRVKAEAKKKFDVYPSAYANGWLVQEYKRRGGKYKTITKGDFTGHPFRGNQHTAGKGRGTRDVRGKTNGGGSGKSADFQAKQHAQEIDASLRTKHGDKVADTWKPLVEHSLKTWYNNGDMNEPIKIGGKSIQVGGREISAVNVMDTMADALGLQAITRRNITAEDFRTGSAVQKGDFQGHPFRGNQWTKGVGVKLPMMQRIATGASMEGANTPSALKAMALAGGFTYNPKRNETRKQGFAVAVDKRYEKKFTEEEFKKRGEEIIKQYVKDHAEQLAQPKAHLGAWLEEGHIFLDVSNVQRTLSEAANVGRANDQIGVFDLAKFTTHFRHMSPTTGTYKYLPAKSVRGIEYLVDAVGKAMKGVMLIPAETIDDTTIPKIVQQILDSVPISKDEPTSSDVHVDTLMNNQKRKLKRKRMRMDFALQKGDFIGHPFRGNQWARGMGGMVGRAAPKDPTAKPLGGGSGKSKTQAQKDSEYDALPEKLKWRYVGAPKDYSHDMAMNYARAGRSVLRRNLNESEMREFCSLSAQDAGIYSRAPLGTKHSDVIKNIKSGKQTRQVPPGMRPITAADRARLAKEGYPVPPAWKEVLVSKNPKGKNGTLYTGIDATGREQPRQSREARQKNAKDKFGRVAKVEQELAKLDKQLKTDVAKDVDEAVACLLIRKTGMRPGSTTDTGASQKAYGVTTLEARHVTVNGMTTTFKFTGKKGVALSIKIKDQQVADAMRKRLSTRRGSEKLFSSSATKVNEYLKKHTGDNNFKLKDLRTSLATRKAFELISKMPAPKSKAEFKRLRNQVGDQVSELLGNRRAEALTSYINPTVFAKWAKSVGA